MTSHTTVLPASDDFNVVTRLRSTAARCGSRTALVVDTVAKGRRQITFAELWNAVDQAGVGLQSRGLAPGMRAIVMVPMSIELYILLLAVLKIGAAAVFVDPWIGLRQVAAFAAFSEPSAFIGVAKSHWLRLLERRLRSIRMSVTTGRRLLLLPARHTLDELLQSPGDGVVQAVRPDDAALITFTSGSSGAAKGANRTHGFLVAQHEALKAEFPYDDVDIDMPMFPVFALNNLATGITSIVPDIDFRKVAECDGARLLRQIRSERVTMSTASPPFFDRLAEACAKNGEPAWRPRRLLTGGAPVNDDQLRRWCAAWPEARVEVVYGSTEAEPVAHIEARDRLPRGNPADPAQGYLLGKPAACVAWRIVRITHGPIVLDADGWRPWQVAQGGPGELVVAGAHVGKDYFRNPAATAENKIVDADGTVWHRMGDTVYADAEGLLWLVGRVHSTITRAGTLVHPQLVEAAARGDDRRIRRIAAVGQPDPTLGERVAVVVQIDSGVDPQIVADDARRRLQSAGFPNDRLIVTRDSLPVDPRHNSKIDYPMLRSRLAEGKVAAIVDLAPVNRS